MQIQISERHSKNVSLLSKALTANRSQNQQIQARRLSGDQNSVKNSISTQQENLIIQKANFFLTIMTIMKTVIGVGILGLPFVFSQLGWCLGLIIFIITAVLNQYTCYLLLKCKNMAFRSNYSTIGYYITNSKAFLGLLNFIVVFNNFGVCMAQLTIFKQIIRQIVLYKINLTDAWYLKSWFTVGICLGLLLIPLALVRKIQKLRFLAFIGISAISIFVIGLITNFFLIMKETNWILNSNIRAFPQPGGAWNGIASVSNVLLAFLYQMNFFPIYKGMKDSTDKKMLGASLIGTIACFLLYLTVGLLGYLSYANSLNSNFLLALNSPGVPRTPTGLYILMNASFLSSVFCSFPVLFFGARNNFIALIKLIINSIRSISLKKDKKEIIFEDRQQKRKKQEKMQTILFYVLTFFLYIFIFTLAITIGNLGVIFNLIGGISANAIGFVLPSFFYVALVIKLKKIKKINFYLALVLFCITLPFGFISVAAEYIT